MHFTALISPLAILAALASAAPAERARPEITSAATTKETQAPVSYASQPHEGESPLHRTEAAQPPQSYAPQPLVNHTPQPDPQSVASPSPPEIEAPLPPIFSIFERQAPNGLPTEPTEAPQPPQTYASQPHTFAPQPPMSIAPQESHSSAPDSPPERAVPLTRIYSIFERQVSASLAPPTTSKRYLPTIR